MHFMVVKAFKKQNNLQIQTSKRIRENIHSPRYGRPRGIFVTMARGFQIILKLEDTRFYVGGFLY